MDVMIVTNNKRVLDTYAETMEVEGDFLDVLIRVRDLVHKGYRPINHPLPASIRMFYSPVRSIIVKKEINDKSIEIIENSIANYRKTMGVRTPDHANYDDYEVIDKKLLTASMEEYLGS